MGCCVVSSAWGYGSSQESKVSSQNARRPTAGDGEGKGIGRGREKWIVVATGTGDAVASEHRGPLRGSPMDKRDQHLDMTRDAWDAYQADYMAFHLREWPRFHEHFTEGGLMLDDYLVQMLGDVAGLRLLDTCCACDAKQAFSWANLGAAVTACDISPAAVAIAKDNADRIGLAVEFHVADAQTLTPIGDASFDVVFATYLCWLEDLPLGYRTWHRTLRPQGRLLVHARHPVTYWLDEKDGGIVSDRDYQDTGPVYEEFRGTPLADRHGGWGRSMPCVEFHHTLAEMINAGLAAGLRLERAVEASNETDAVLSSLPTHVALLWRK